MNNTSYCQPACRFYSLMSPAAIETDRKSSKECFLDYLSDEVILQIAHELPAKDIVLFGRTCKRFRNLSKKDLLWKPIAAPFFSKMQDWLKADETGNVGYNSFPGKKDFNKTINTFLTFSKQRINELQGPNHFNGKINKKYLEAKKASQQMVTVASITALEIQQLHKCGLVDFSIDVPLDQEGLVNCQDFYDSFQQRANMPCTQLGGCDNISSQGYFLCERLVAAFVNYSKLRRQRDELIQELTINLFCRNKGVEFLQVFSPVKCEEILEKMFEQESVAESKNN